MRVVLSERDYLAKTNPGINLVQPELLYLDLIRKITQFQED
jgi:hypothetical protein